VGWLKTSKQKGVKPTSVDTKKTKVRRKLKKKQGCQGEGGRGRGGGGEKSGGGGVTM